jgi:hypothetical protein
MLLGKVQVNVEALQLVAAIVPEPVTGVAMAE